MCVSSPTIHTSRRQRRRRSLFSNGVKSWIHARRALTPDFGRRDSRIFVINCHVLDTHPTGHSAPWQDVNRTMLGTRSSQTRHKLFSSTKKSQASSLLQGLLCDHVLRKLHLTASLSVKATTLWPCQTRNISISCITFDWSFSLTRSRNSLSSSSLQKARARPLLSYRAPPSREYPLIFKGCIDIYVNVIWQWPYYPPRHIGLGLKFQTKFY